MKVNLSNSPVDNRLVTSINKNNKNNNQATNSINQNKISDLSNIYYTDIVFKRSLKEHKSWGGVIDPKTKEVTFKLFTFDDTKAVDVNIENSKTKEVTVVPLKKTKAGIFETEKPLSPDVISNLDKYSYTITRKDDSKDTVKDPYTFLQEDYMGKSTLFDHSLYSWQDENWFKNDKNRISRIADAKNNLSKLNSAKIAEVNIDTLTKEGTYTAAKEALSNIADLGFNCVEIMPLENTKNPNWGYDSPDKFAPSFHRGTPDELKDLIDYLHSKSVNVIIDFVPNHIGIDGSMLNRTGPYSAGGNPFGEAFNFEGENSRYVRDFIANAALNWVNNYHADGLRLDMTKFMDSDITMQQIAAEVNYHHPDVFLIAEDGRNGVATNGSDFWNAPELHDKRVSHPLLPQDYGMGESEKIHDKKIDEIGEMKVPIARLGYDSEWDFNFYHSLSNVLYNSIADDLINLDLLEHSIACSQGKTIYLTSHDETGNFDGNRLITKWMAAILDLKKDLKFNSKDDARIENYAKLKHCSYNDAKEVVKSQKTQFAAENLATIIATGSKEEDIKNYEKEYGEVDLTKAKKAYQKAFNIHKMAYGLLYSIPAQQMVLQGDEQTDLTPFRFYRKIDFLGDEQNLQIEKGYDTGFEALNKSKLGQIEYSPETKELMTQHKNLIQELNNLHKEIPALTNGYMVLGNTVKHPFSRVLGVNFKDEKTNSEVFTITNFPDIKYDVDYKITFPKGKWIEVLNTDDKKFGGEGLVNKEIIESNGIDQEKIVLNGNTTTIFKKIDD